MNLTLSEISTLMKQKSPVFIIGGSRSGSSILYRVLQRHSSFRPYNSKEKTGVDLTESKVFYNSCIACYIDNKKPLKYLLNNTDCYHRFLKKTRWIRVFQYCFFTETLSTKIATKFNLLRSLIYKLTFNVILLQTFFYYAEQARGTKRIIEKSPLHVYRIPEIKATFPKAKFIHIYRHPLDVYSSYRQRLKVSLEDGIEKSKLTWLMLSPKDFCELYTKRIQLVLREYHSNPCQFMLIRYEDFISEPELIIRRVCNFLEESYEEECIPENRNEYPEFAEEKMYPNLFGTIKKPTKKWQDYISEADAIFIEDSLSEVMNQLNYPRYTRITPKLSSAMLVAD